MKPTLNGRPVDPGKVDWNKVNIRQFTFVQPPGAKNPLGDVKFMFPNRHDAYIHDTTQRELFAQSFRALSHGRIRVQNPRKLAEVLLGEDKGWDADKVRAMCCRDWSRTKQPCRAQALQRRLTRSRLLCVCHALMQHRLPSRICSGEPAAKARIGAYEEPVQDEHGDK